jgi:hypothetical protein
MVWLRLHIPRVLYASPVPQRKRWNAGSKAVEGLGMWLRGNRNVLCSFGKGCILLMWTGKLLWWNDCNVVYYLWYGEFVGCRGIRREVERIEGVSWLFDTCQHNTATRQYVTTDRWPSNLCSVFSPLMLYLKGYIAGMRKRTRDGEDEWYRILLDPDEFFWPGNSLIEIFRRKKTHNNLTPKL